MTKCFGLVILLRPERAGRAVEKIP